MTDERLEVRLISHSNIVYWWPAWVVGYALALISYTDGIGSTIAPGTVAYIHTSNNPGLLFIATMAILVVFTNARLRGVYSVVTLVSIAFVTVLLAWLGWWDSILGFLPSLSARANMGFYLLFSTVFLVIWLLTFFVVDRLTYWRVRPGQIISQKLIGGGAHSYDTHGLVFEKKDQDFFRHLVLGLGSGDLLLTLGAVERETVSIPNVLLVDSKLKAIQQLIAIKPDQLPLAAASST